METTKLHPMIWIKTIQDGFLKQISTYEELQSFLEENNISEYLKLGSKIEIDGTFYSVKNFRLRMDNTENHSLEDTLYNVYLAIMVDALDE